MIQTSTLFACPHCGKNDSALFCEPHDGGGSRVLVLQGACFHCDKPYKVTVVVTVESEERAEGTTGVRAGDWIGPDPHEWDETEEGEPQS